MDRSLAVRSLASLILMPLVLVGCLPAPGSPDPSLLGHDYLKMSNAELIAYEQQLSDELARAGRATRSDVSVGIGFGTWSGNTGYGVHADKWLGGGHNDAGMALRTRQDEVRAEMKRRHLLPP